MNTSTNIVRLGGRRTLILTHLRRANSENLDICRRMWNLEDPAFSGNAFDKRLSLTESESNLPQDVSLTKSDAKVFSYSGAINDNIPPQNNIAAAAHFVPASEKGFAVPGDQEFYLGGGNLNHCLFNTFRSIVNLKARQNEPVQIIISLGMMYHSGRVDNPLGFVRESNRFGDYLEEEFESGNIRRYRVYTDNDRKIHRFGSGPITQLHWFTSNREMFNSPFFPEINSTQILTRIMNKFNMKTK